MNRTSKRNAIVSALLVIALCVSLMAGATFALFTSESTVNIAVTSGKVSVVATIAEVTSYHLKNASDPTLGYDEDNLTFLAGNTAEIVEGNTLKLSNMTPGDKATFKIVITNYSTVPVQYKTTYTQEGDAELLSALNISCGSSTTWLPLGAAVEGEPPVKVIDCSVVLPADAGNAVQEKSCTLSFTVDAVQGNAETATISDPASINESGEATINTNEGGNDNIKATIPADLASSLASANITSVSLAYTKPQVDDENNTVTFDSVDLVDGNGNIIDLSKYTSSDKKITITLPVDTTVLPNGTVVTIYHDGEMIATDVVVGDDGTITYDAEHLCMIEVKPGSVWDGTTTEAPKADERGVYHITNAAEFIGYIRNTNTGNTYVLDTDIDLGGYTINVADRLRSSVCGSDFDGQYHTVSNFTLKGGSGYSYTSLFGYMSVSSVDGAPARTIKDLIVRNATVIGGKQTAVILSAANKDAGYTNNATVINCRVYDSTIIGEKKVAAVVGYTESGTVKDCYAENCKIYCAENNAAECGEIVGYINTTDGHVDNTTDNNNSCKNVTVKYGVTVVSDAAELAAALPKGGNIFLLNDLTLSEWTTAKISNKTLTLYGNNKTITGLTKPLINFYGGTCTINDLTVKDSVVSANGNDGTGNLGVGIILEEAQWANLYMNNCHVKNCSVNVGGDNARAGALVGYWIGGGEIKDCTVADCTVYGVESAGGIVGHSQMQSGYEAKSKVTSCSVKNTSVSSEKYAGMVLGRKSTGAFEINDCTYTGNAYGNIWDGGECTVIINGITYTSAD